MTAPVPPPPAERGAEPKPLSDDEIDGWLRASCAEEGNISGTVIRFGGTTVEPRMMQRIVATLDAARAERDRMRDLVHLGYDLVAESIGKPQYDFKARAEHFVESARAALGKGE